MCTGREGTNRHSQGERNSPALASSSSFVSPGTPDYRWCPHLHQISPHSVALLCFRPLWKHPKGPTELSADPLRCLLILDPIELTIVVTCHTWPVKTLHSSRLRYCLWDWSKNDGAEFHKRKKHTWSPSLSSTDLPWSLSLWVFVYGKSH